MVRPLKNTPPTNKPFQSQITCYKDTRNGVGFFGSRVAILDDLADHLLVQTPEMSSHARATSLMADEQDALALPPTGPDGALLHVDFRITVFHIGKVDTRELH